MRLIDADALLERMRKDPLFPLVERYGVSRVIDAEPTAEPKNEEWNQIEIIDDDSGNGVNDDASQCSVCGDVFDSYYLAKTYFNYCPNCGAKMGGEQE